MIDLFVGKNRDLRLSVINHVCFLFLFLSLSGCWPERSKENRVEFIYPLTPQEDVSDEFFGTTIEDPYRWLEDDRSKKTTDWVDAQNKVSGAYLSSLPSRSAFRERLERLMNYERESAPFVEGRFTYFYRNTGLQNQPVIYREDRAGDESVFLDPNKFSIDGTSSVDGLSFSTSASHAAYQVSEGGADWRSVEVIDTETLVVVDRIEDVKFSSLSWYGDEGFYYSRYDEPKGNELTAKTDQHKLYFHKLGESQSDDRLVYGGGANEKHRYVSGQVTEDNEFLVIYASNSTSGNKLFLRDLRAEETELLTVVADETSDIAVLHSEEGEVFAITNRKAPNGRLIKFAIENCAEEKWKTVIGESVNVLEISAVGGYFFASYMVDTLSKVYQIDLSGKIIREVALPGQGSATGFSGKRGQKRTYFSFENYHSPPTIFSFDLDEGLASIYRQSKVQFDQAAYTSQQVFFSSKDGTRIPMMITARRDVDRQSPAPTILYGYGGFDISLTPAFSSTTAAWLESGGVYAVPNIRGGGEYGKGWHEQGTQMDKQNVFDDFIAAAEQLFELGITSPDLLAISGRSNGGLLVGAVMTQRPDLAAVALPAVGVLDMLRYHTFTAGAGWAYDYGTAEQSKEMFEYLLGYSPVHNVREGVSYPATLVTTADHDDRVVPAHSFKFAAELQKKHRGQSPVLIRIDKDAGHGAGMPTDMVIDYYADVFAFTLENMAN